MIIIIGPDSSGKTVLARRLEIEAGLSYFHYNKDSKYLDYIRPMCSLDWWHAVLDRHAICEYPYHKVMDRPFAFTLKQWHNIILTILAYNPLIMLCTNKPSVLSYPDSQYLPFDKWDECLRLYREFLNTHHIPYIEYDYKAPINLNVILKAEETFRRVSDWWVPMWKAGWGYVGSVRPKVLLVAERIGPNNIHNIPFEVGPTGYMLSELLYKTGTPLGKFAVTNIVKSYRKDERDPNAQDLELLGIELDNLNPEKVMFMGAVAKKGIVEVRKRKLEHTEITHFGYYSHKGDTSVERYMPIWHRLFFSTKTSLL